MAKRGQVRVRRGKCRDRSLGVTVSPKLASTMGLIPTSGPSPGPTPRGRRDLSGAEPHSPWRAWATPSHALT